MNDFLTYLFWPNPGNASYGSPKVMALLLLCFGLIAASFFIRAWRKRASNPITKKLSRSWASAALSFGLFGIVLLVARVEGIQFIAMRFLWVIWGLVALIYLVFQLRSFRKRHYEVLPRAMVDDPRDRYMPKKKRH